MKKTWIAAARFIGIGWYVGLCIAGGVLGGRWIGQQLDQSEALFTLLGLAVGLVLAVYGVYASYMLLMKGEQGDNDEEEK